MVTMVTKYYVYYRTNEHPASDYGMLVPPGIVTYNTGRAKKSELKKKKKC